MSDDRGPVRLAARREGGRRPLPIVFAFLGIVVLSFAQAAERGMMDGIRVGWPVYLVGVVLIGLGVFGMGRSTEPESGASGESSETAGKRGRVDDLQATLDRMKGRGSSDTSG